MLRKDILKSQRAAGSADPEEIRRFDALAEEWWKPNGAFRMVHAFNTARVGYLSRHLPSLFGRDPNTPRPLKGMTLLDLGCGAGLVAEPMARLGAAVTGIDATERNVAIAARHAAAEGLAVAYRHALPEVLVAEGQRFDIVLTLEVVEHVADLDGFLASTAALVRPGGVVVVGTLNRTLKSYALAIAGAEYVLGWLPRGTHDWRKFVTPAELATALGRGGLAAGETSGVVFDPLRWRWRMSADTSVNYLATFRASV
jgi:2-polyprenyl-6-hydroxyphenyl methylase/3-demethylubiquinone-9 3-methyltransferase